jgi:hypothetical protein
MLEPPSFIPTFSPAGLDRPLLVLTIMRRRAALTLGGALALFAAGVGTGASALASRAEGADIDASATHRVERRGVPVERTIPAPLQLGPHYAEASAASVTLSWRLQDGTDGARVEVSSRLTFDDGATERHDVDGEQLAIAPAAGVWYWRTRGRSDGAVGETTSPTWMFYVEPEAPAIRPNPVVHPVVSKKLYLDAQPRDEGASSLSAYDRCLQTYYFHGLPYPYGACGQYRGWRGN